MEIARNEWLDLRSWFVMENNQHFQMLYHLSETMKDQKKDVQDLNDSMQKLNVKYALMQKDIDTLLADWEAMKTIGILPSDPRDVRRDRVKDTATGGGIGAVIVAIVIALWEYFSKKLGL